MHQLRYAENDCCDVSGLKNFTRFSGWTSASHPDRPFISRRNISQSSEILESRTQRRGRRERAIGRGVCVPVIFSYVLYLSRRVHTLVLVTRSWRASARTNKIFRVNEVRDAAPPGEPLISTSHTWIQLRRTSIRESSPRIFFPLGRIARPYALRACVRIHAYVCACTCVRGSACWVNVRVRSSRVTYDATH